jgi:hypothetical protein
MPAAQLHSSASRRQPSRTQRARTAIPSGRGWAARFPVSVTTRDLTEPFRGNVERFLDALRSRHMLGFGIDMNVQWGGALSLPDADGNVIVIDTLPRSGLNLNLHRVGATYGVIKYNRSGRDDPHWSDNGA